MKTINQLEFFFRQHKKSQGDFFRIHFENYNCDKLIFDLSDSLDKKPLYYPVFSPNCCINKSNNDKTPRICLFNIETINSLLNEEKFDETSKIICPLCKNHSNVMSFFYEESIFNIIEKIHKFSNFENDEKIFRISIKSNYKWKTKNYIYLKGVVKFKGQIQNYDDIKQLENFNYLDNENLSNFDCKNFEIFQDENEEEKNSFTKIEKKNDFFFLPYNTNLLISVEFSNTNYKFRAYQLLMQNKSSKMIRSLLIYENYKYCLTDQKNNFLIFTDAGTILKNNKEISFHSENQSSQIIFDKFFSFEKRFHSPQIHSFNDSIFLIGGLSINDESLTNCYKIIINEVRYDKKTIRLENLPNIRIEYSSILMKEEEKIYVCGGKILKNEKFLVENNLIDIYDIKNNKWSTLFLQNNIADVCFSIFPVKFLFNYKENEFFMLGDEIIYALNLKTQTINKEKIDNYQENSSMKQLFDAITDSINSFNLDSDQFKYNKKFIIFKYNFII